MLVALTLGRTLWVATANLKGDWIIIAANNVGMALPASVLTFKLRHMHSPLARFAVTKSNTGTMRIQKCLTRIA
jgi:hypothetical protein